MKPTRRWLRRLAAGLAVFALLAVWASGSAQAAETRSGENIVIGAGEVVAGDLYAVATTVTIDGTVQGDLVAAASQVTINGTVEGDLLVAAQAVVINGAVGDDARTMGQAVQLGPGARVAGDLAVGALSLESVAGSTVAGDALIGAYQARLSGGVGRSILGGLNRLDLRGTVGGDVNVAVSSDDLSAVQFSPAGPLPIPSVSPGLTIANSARIDGKLTYQAITEADVQQGAQIVGGTSFEETSITTTAAAPAPALALLRRFAGLLLAGLLLLWLAPAWTRRMGESLTAAPLPSLGWGLVGFVTFLAAILAILITTIALAVAFGVLTLGGLVAWTLGFGLVLGSALVFGYVTFAAYIAVGIVSVVAGRWLLQRLQPAWSERSLAALLVGLVLYVALSAIPLVGPLAGVLVVVLALGALWQWGSATLGRGRPAARPIGGLQPV